MSGYHKRGVEPFPVHALKRVELHTTEILDDQVQRLHERKNGFNKAAPGDYGEVLKTERGRFVLKYPLSAALMLMQMTLREIVDGIIAREKDPIPEDPAALSRHVKELAYFLRADAIGICNLPPYAVYTHCFP